MGPTVPWYPPTQLRLLQPRQLTLVPMACPLPMQGILMLTLACLMPMLMLDTPMVLLVMPMELLVMLMDILMLVLAMPMGIMGILMLDLLLTPMVLLSQLNLLSLSLPVLNTLLLMLLHKNQILCWNYLLQCCEFSSKYFTNTENIKFSAK